MARHKGKPAGRNKEEHTETGIPSDFRPAHVKRDQKLSNYIEDDERIGENIRIKHPNRHPGKRNPTGGGGYRS